MPAETSHDPSDRTEDASRASSAARPPSKSTTVFANLRYDLPASLVVFLVALPLSLGIAAASGAPLAAGVIAAVVGGIVAGVFGGSPLTVSGPAAGMVVVVAGLVEEFGFAVTAAITVAAGLLQILLGLSRIARSVMAISPTVLHAMLAGIGITIVLGQLHVLLGGKAGSDAFENITNLPSDVVDADVPALMLGLAAVVLLLVWPKLPARVRAVPGPLVAVVFVTVIAQFAVPSAARVELGGSITDSIKLPDLPSGMWGAVLVGVFTVAVIASVESLLSAVATDTLAQGRQKSNLDRELVGQGLANTTSGLIGGLPVTGVIVRSTANVNAGARTRASAILHGVWMALAALVLVELIELIPLAALAALLVTVGIGLVKIKDIKQSREHGQLLVYVVTVAGVVFLNLLEGVIIGLALSAVLVIRRAVWAKIDIDIPGPAEHLAGAAWHVNMRGTLSFLAVPRITAVLGRVPGGSAVEMDIHVDYIDHTAYDYIAQWRTRHEATGGTVAVRQVGPTDIGEHDKKAMRSDLMPKRWFATWNDWQPTQEPDSPLAQPFHAGLADYQANFAEHLRPAMSELADGQHPDAMFITCADSRIVPNIITSSGPGDLFTVRNIGNMVPDEHSDDTSVLAAVEYAVDVLGVSRIVVCGHSGCGAMKALLDGPPEGAIARWLAAGAESVVEANNGHATAHSCTGDDLDRLARTNVAVQVEHLAAMDVVARAQRDRGLELVGMFFDIPSATCTVLDSVTGAFKDVDAKVVAGTTA